MHTFRIAVVFSFLALLGPAARSAPAEELFLLRSSGFGMLDRLKRTGEI